MLVMLSATLVALLELAAGISKIYPGYCHYFEAQVLRVTQIRKARYTWLS